MKSILLSFCIPLFFLCPLAGEEGGSLPPQMEKDSRMDEILERIYQLEESIGDHHGGHIRVGGDVRFQFQATSETANGINQIGLQGQYPDIPARNFDVEFNLLLDYKAKNSWASVKIEFDNDAGASSGTVDSLALQRALLGVRLADEDWYNLDLEVGRLQMDYLFDSKIEFGSFFDGILFKYMASSARWGDPYFYGGPFVVNDVADHIGIVLEAGILSLFNTGLYAKYSFINWGMKGYSTKAQQLTYAFADSQLILGYEFIPKKIKKVTNIYLAGLINSRAKSVPQTNYRLANKAFYAGVSMGILQNPGDFAFDINYQYVEPQAIPDFDANGIGRNNTANSGLYTTEVGGNGEITTVYNATGNANYKGISITLLYQFTENLTLQQSWQQAVNQDPNIGPNIRFKQYEIELVYAF